MSNIMIIYPRPDENKSPRFGFSYDMLTIATVLSNEGHRIIIKDFSCESFCRDIFSKEIMDNSIDLTIVEFDSFALKRSENYNHGLELVDIVKKVNGRIPVIAYGHYCCISQEDITMADITIKENGLNGIIDAIAKKESIQCELPPIIDLDSLPFINRTLLDQIEFYKQNRKSTLIRTAEGCENTCVFCQRKGWQKNIQTHSDQYVIDEFKLLKEQGFINIWITDENFTFNLARAKRLLKLFIADNVTEQMKISISSWSNIDKEFLELASKANVKAISMGIESGNQKILEFYKKNIDLAKTKSIVRYANELGIFTIGNFIIGAPMENYATIDETFTFIRECEFDQVNIKTLDYMMGSELYDSVRDIALGCSHIFACSENRINQFGLQEISDTKNKFLMEYNTEKKDRLEKKILTFGTPYDVIWYQ